MKVTNEQIVKALRNTGGVISTAAENLKVGRQLIYDRIKKSDNLKVAKDQAVEEGIDIAESMLLKKIKEGDTTSIIFFLKTRGRKRGYSEKQEIESGNLNLNSRPQIVFNEPRNVTKQTL